MEYRSPLGYNFKFEKSLSASREENKRETPKSDDYIGYEGGGRRNFDSDNIRNSGGKMNTPSWKRGGNQSNWRSPNSRQYKQDEPTPIEQFYHPSMLENPWEELEKN